MNIPLSIIIIVTEKIIFITIDQEQRLWGFIKHQASLQVLRLDPEHTLTQKSTRWQGRRPDALFHIVDQHLSFCHISRFNLVLVVDDDLRTSRPISKSLLSSTKSIQDQKKEKTREGENKNEDFFCLNGCAFKNDWGYRILFRCIIWLPDDFLILTFVAESEATKIFHVYTDSDTNGQFCSLKPITYSGGHCINRKQNERRNINRRPTDFRYDQFPHLNVFEGNNLIYQVKNCYFTQFFNNSCREHISWK